MTQSGPDEISQGTDAEPPSAVQALARFWAAERSRLRPRRPRPRTVIAAAAATALAIGGVTAGLLLSRPSYPHPWCAPVVAELNNHDTELGLEATLARLQQRDRAPVGRLVADLYDYTEAHNIEHDGDDLAPFADIAATKATAAAVRADLRAIDRKCAQPPGAYRSQPF
jgi:hypothetical protein